MHVTLRKWSALLGAVALISIAGCADRNKNGQPESPATSSEIDKTLDKAGDVASKAAENAEKAASNAVDSAGKAMKNVDDAAMTPKIQAAFLENASLRESKINVDSKDSGITLSGTVKNEAQKKLAGEIAKKNAPTYKITNNLKVSGGASPVMNKKN